jgi:hypothetical protein
MFNSFLQIIKALIPKPLQPHQTATRMLKTLESNGTIVTGLFSGLKYPTQSVCSANRPKLLGAYEIEIVPIFNRFRDGDFSTIINVGAAEGYYALGCARLWPSVRVIAYETDLQGRKLLMDYARRNGVESRIDCRGTCSARDFAAVLRETKKGFIIMDIEGGEDVLLCRENLPALAPFHILVELHDIRVERLGEKLRERFEASHEIEEVHTRPRKLSDFTYPANPLLRLYLLAQLKAMTDELRGAPMRWFMMTPRANPAQSLL